MITSKLKIIFGDKRIVGLAGEKSTGKTNNLVHLIKDFRKTNKDTPIFIYGFPESVTEYLKKYGVTEISCLEHLVRKKDCILLLDECQKLKLNDRRNKEQLNNFVDFIYHNNVYAIFSSPNLREFNTIIGGVIEKWLLKNVRTDLCINGSQLKAVIEKYKGRRKSLNAIEVKKNELLLINDDEETIIKCPYVREADSKKGLIDIFATKNCQRIVPLIVKKLSKDCQEIVEVK
jgi:hypothetical protein